MSPSTSWRARLRPRITPVLLGILAVGLIAGTTRGTVRWANQQFRADLLRQVQLTAGALNLTLVSALRGTEADVGTPEYTRLKEQLISIRASNLECQFVYLMAQRPGGPIIFLVDSEPADSKDYSPPGQIYEEATTELLDLFTAPKAEVQGPTADRWGNWVSAFVPVPAQRGDGAQILLGMDVLAADWMKNVVATAALPASLFAIAILLGMYALLLLHSRRELRLRQAQLANSEVRFNELAEQSRTYLWEVDAAGLFFHVSPTVEAILGYRPDELAGRKYCYDLHPPEGREEFKQALYQLAETKAPFKDLVNPVQTKSGGIRWVTSSGIPVLNADGTLRGYRGSDSDVTGLRLAEEQVRALLAESNQSRLALLGILEDHARTEADLKRLATAIEQSADSIVVTDAQAIIQYVNPAFEAVTGYARAEVIGQSPRVLKSGRHDAAFYGGLWDTLTSGKTWQGRFVNKRKDGTLYTEDAVISPVVDGTGAITNFVAVKRDISEHLRLSEQLAQSQKMDSIGRLAGGVAHDFNNMLSVILGQAEMALEDLRPGEGLRDNLVEIQKAAKRSADLTRQLLAFARKQTATPKVLDLNRTVESMLSMLRRLIGENAKLVSQLGANLWPIKMDPSQLDQILANLCTNARDAIHGDGQIIIRTGQVRFSPEEAAHNPAIRPGDFVCLEIRDTGEGIDPQTLPHIFEPFFTTKAVGEGTGLGLATIYGVVQQNGGFIQVQSELGRGSCFQIYLPRHGEAADTSTPETGDLPAGRKSATILVAEDDPVILKTTAQMLKTLGYAVRESGRPEEALRWASQSGQNFDLLLTDVIMPDMNGRELARQIKILHPQIRCVFMSGYPANVISRQGILDDDIVFIQKPFTLNKLATTIHDALLPGA